MEKKKRFTFNCRVCGCDEYKEEVVDSNGVVGMPGKYSVK
jgi:hypothetical protein